MRKLLPVLVVGLCGFILPHQGQASLEGAPEVAEAVRIYNSLSDIEKAELAKNWISAEGKVYEYNEKEFTQAPMPKFTQRGTGYLLEVKRSKIPVEIKDTFLKEFVVGGIPVFINLRKVSEAYIKMAKLPSMPSTFLGVAGLAAALDQALALEIAKNCKRNLQEGRSKEQSKTLKGTALTELLNDYNNLEKASQGIMKKEYLGNCLQVLGEFMEKAKSIEKP